MFHSSRFHHICNIKCRLDCRYSPQNISNAKNFNPHKKPIFMLNVPICTQCMQRTWWPEAGTIIVTGPYWYCVTMASLDEHYVHKITVEVVMEHMWYVREKQKMVRKNSGDVVRAGGWAPWQLTMTKWQIPAPVIRIVMINQGYPAKRALSTMRKHGG